MRNIPKNGRNAELYATSAKKMRQVNRMKYIIELDEIPNTGLYKARGANTLVFDKKGIENILEPYEEEHEIDWDKVAVDTPILVRDFENEVWKKKTLC